MLFHSYKSILNKYFIYFLIFNYSNRFTIKNGHVTYQNRILQSDAYQQAYKTGRSCYSEYGTSKYRDDSNTFNDKKKSESSLSWFFTR